MNDATKSLIRHILTALGVVLGLIGLDKFTGIVQFILENLDGVWSAIATLVGFVLTLFGFLKDKERLGL